MSTMDDPHVYFIMFNRRSARLFVGKIERIGQKTRKYRRRFYSVFIFLSTFGFHKKKFQFQY